LASAPPFLNPDSSVDARRAEDRRRTTAEAAAKQQAADEAKRISEAAAKTAAAVSPTDRPSSDPKERITRFVNAYDGGDCFFVTPVSVADGSATLEGYGGSATPFEVLDYEFKRANGFEATVGYYNVTSQQCPAVSFLSRLRNQRGPAPRLDVSAGNLRSNGYVTGFISDFGNRHVELLMVDHEGIVQSLTKLLKGSGDTRNFTINIRRGDAGAPKLQLLFVLASTKPIETLKAGQVGSGEIGASDQVFPKVLDEVLQAGQALNVTAKSFNLEK
jgi:serine/threonine-protein kinase